MEGMIYVEGNAAYAMFLESDFWRAMSLAKRKEADFTCERCGKREECQAHHKFYGEHWFDVRMEDLECVCRGCHEVEHGLRVEVKVEVKVEVGQVMSNPPVEVAGEWTRKSLNQARSQNRISREEYLKVRTQNGWSPGQSRYVPGQRKHSKVAKKQKGNKHRKKGQSKVGLHKQMKKWSTAGPSGMNIHKRWNWVNRDRSSN
jgi:hypothetical protein